jgi:RNA polymerase sigma-70 factor (ECF subfamily)
VDFSMDDSDQVLVQRWQRGEAAAFELLVRRWQTPIARLLARLLGADGQIQDLCQEVFLRVYQHGARFRGDAAFSTWIYRIALNLARDAGRRQKRVVLRLADFEPSANGTTAHASCEQEEVIHAVSAALAELPEELREVLVLRHYEGLNFEAIARLPASRPAR